MAERGEICNESLHPDNTRLDRSQHPAFIEKHLLDMARYRAFLPGQRDKSAETGQGMAQYIEDWEKKWEELAGSHNNGHPKL